MTESFVMKLTPEQQAVVDAATDPNRPRLTVIGYAGAAKTTTMLAVAKAMDGKRRRGSAFFFNRAMAEEMKERIQRDGIAGLRASTLHSLAFRAMKPRYGARVGERLIASKVAESLKFGSVLLPCLPRPITPTGAAYIAMDSLRVYCHSAEASMEDRHLRAGDHEAALWRDIVRNALKRHSLSLAEAVFADGGDMPMPHDVYLKRYVEDVAAGIEQGPAGDYLIGDEFQDSNGVTMKLMRTMSGRGAQTVIAGDPYQQIYQWRGSVDAMSRIDTDATMELTQSFRFGQSLADLASQILGYLGASVALKGNPEVSTDIVASGDGYPNTGRMAVICRTNGGVIEAAMRVIGNGSRCYIPKASGMIDLVADIQALRERQRPTRTALRVFKDFDEFIEHTEKSADGGEYRTLLKLIGDFGASALIGLLTNAATDGPDRTVVMTAHGAKGLQFPAVKLWGDFPDWEELMKKPLVAQEELRLLYVACTRAQRVLDIGRAKPLMELREGQAPTAAGFVAAVRAARRKDRQDEALMAELTVPGKTDDTLPSTAAESRAAARKAPRRSPDRLVVVDLVRDKPRRSGRGRIARTAKPSYNGLAAGNPGSLRQGMPEVTPVEVRAAVAHSAQEPAEATQGRLNAASERRRNLRPLGRGGCQNGDRW